MTHSDRCPECGAERSAGMCPRCLIRLGIDGPGPDRSRPSLSADTSDFTGDATTAPGVLDSIAASIGPVPRVLLRDTAPGEEPGPIVRQPDAHDDDPSIRYRIDGEIARGGMGAVLKGRDPDLGRDVALKVLRDDLRDNFDMVRRFVEEAQIGGPSGGVVPIYGNGHLRRSQALLRDEAGQGPHLASCSRTARTLPPVAPLPLDLRGHRPDRRLCARPRRDPPRPQALQRDGGELRRGAGDGLGAGQGAAAWRRGGRREGRQARSPGDRDRHRPQRLRGFRPLPRRFGDGHAGVHGAGAGARRDRSRRRAGRRLRAGLDPLRNPQRRAGLPGPLLLGDPAQGGAGGPGRRCRPPGLLRRRRRADRHRPGLPGARAGGSPAARRRRGRAGHRLSRRRAGPPPRRRARSRRRVGPRRGGDRPRPGRAPRPAVPGRVSGLAAGADHRRRAQLHLLAPAAPAARRPVRPGPRRVHGRARPARGQTPADSVRSGGRQQQPWPRSTCSRGKTYS